MKFLFAILIFISTTLALAILNAYDWSFDAFLLLCIGIVVTGVVSITKVKIPYKGE